MTGKADKKGIRAYGYKIGEGTPGPNNTITDVPGVAVGNTTVDTGENHTGVTVILPCEGLIYKKKPVAAVFAQNGYGKTMGSIQIEELGSIETPIALTNTLNVGKVADALIGYTVRQCRKSGVPAPSINPVVGETNDRRINRIEKRAVGQKEVFSAISSASSDFEQGAVGAGRGTICFGLKGGIGSASRQISYGESVYTIGALVQSNFGTRKDFTLCGRNIGSEINEKLAEEEPAHKGSIMIVIGTDLPLTARQLKRVLKRATVALVRTGSYLEHGSGDVFIGFTNGNFMPEKSDMELLTLQCFPENQIDLLFRAAAEATEEAILNSLIYADSSVMLDGSICHCLREFL